MNTPFWLASVLRLPHWEISNVGEHGQFVGGERAAHPTTIRAGKFAGPCLYRKQPK